MVKRTDYTIDVDEQPIILDIKIAFPEVKSVAVYYSVQKNCWCISCICSESEAKAIKRMFSANS